MAPTRIRALSFAVDIERATGFADRIRADLPGCRRAECGKPAGPNPRGARSVRTSHRRLLPAVGEIRMGEQGGLRFHRNRQTKRNRQHRQHISVHRRRHPPRRPRSGGVLPRDPARSAGQQGADRRQRERDRTRQGLHQDLGRHAADKVRRTLATLRKGEDRGGAPQAGGAEQTATDPKPVPGRKSDGPCRSGRLLPGPASGFAGASEKTGRSRRPPLLPRSGGGPAGRRRKTLRDHKGAYRQSFLCRIQPGREAVRHRIGRQDRPRLGCRIRRGDPQVHRQRQKRLRSIQPRRKTDPIR